MNVNLFVLYHRVQRNILADKPRVTRFPHEFDTPSLPDIPTMKTINGEMDEMMNDAEMMGVDEQPPMAAVW